MLTNDSNDQLRTKRFRTKFTEDQIAELDHHYQINAYIHGIDRMCLAEKLRLSDSQVKIWFQNRRQKEKKEEHDSTRIKKRMSRSVDVRVEASSVDTRSENSIVSPAQGQQPFELAPPSSPQLSAATIDSPQDIIQDLMSNDGCVLADEELLEILSSTCSSPDDLPQCHQLQYPENAGPNGNSLFAPSIIMSQDTRRMYAPYSDTHSVIRFNNYAFPVPTPIQQTAESPNQHHQLKQMPSNSNANPRYDRSDLSVIDVDALDTY